MTNPLTPDEDALLHEMLGGRRPIWRRDETPRYRRKLPTPISDPAALDSAFQRLLWDCGEPIATIQDARLAEFNWETANVGYDELSAWIVQGATIHDKRLLWDLAANGITPDVTAQWWTSTARGSETIMSALLTRKTDVKTVVGLIESGDLIV